MVLYLNIQCIMQGKPERDEIVNGRDTIISYDWLMSWTGSQGCFSMLGKQNVILWCWMCMGGCNILHFVIRFHELVIIILYIYGSLLHAKQLSKQSTSLGGCCGVYSGADQRKPQSSASLAFVWEIHRWAVNSPHKWLVMQKMFPFDDVIMLWPDLIIRMKARVKRIFTRFQL